MAHAPRPHVVTGSWLVCGPVGPSSGWFVCWQQADAGQQHLSPPVVLDLMKTQEAFQASVAEFDTGAEFWDMLEVAADQGHPRRDP